MPKIEKVYEDSNAEVNPHFNPFLQLNDKSADKLNEVKLPYVYQLEQQIPKPPVAPALAITKPDIQTILTPVQPVIQLPPP
jgi:hypothetical protein